ncbi:MAG: hypothetical protein IK066_12635 [Kiritimatiellae bacterium]|nr:hypothetical protein [Kiritimatiellia bacterium]
MNIRTVLAVAALLAAGTGGVQPARADAPETIVPGTVNFQARLVKKVDGNPVPLTGSQHVAFRLYDAAEGGTLVWARKFPVTCSANGTFNLVLNDDGAVLGRPAEERLADAFQGTARYFELEVEGVGTLRPRMRVPTAPYAFNAQYALWGEGDFKVGGTLSVADDAEFKGVVQAESGSVDSLTVKSGGGEFCDVTVGGTVSVPAGKPNEAIGVVPVGGILIWTSETIPDGWAVCDGDNDTPDLRGLFVMAAGNGHEVGETGGAPNVTLEVEHLPPHSHGYWGPSATDGGIFAYTDQSGDCWKTGTAATTDIAGGGEPHENRPPFHAVYYIMRVR